MPRPDGSMQLVAEQRPGVVDECSPVFTPRGVSLAVKGPPWIPRTDRFDGNVSLERHDFDLLATAGVNVLRLGVMMPGVLPNPPVNGKYEPDQAYLAKAQHIVAEAAKYGIYTLVDFHQDVISEFFCGEGLPRWVGEEIDDAFNDEFTAEVLELIDRLHLKFPFLENKIEDEIKKNIHKAAFPAPLRDPYGRRDSWRKKNETRIYSWNDCDKGTWYEYQFSFAAGHAYRRLFDLESSTFRHMLAYWDAVTKAFKNNTNVLAFDLFNEPFPGSPFTEPWMIMPGKTGDRLFPFYKNISEAIHKIDPHRLVTFSPVTWEEGGYYLRQVDSPGKIMCNYLAHLLDHSIPECESFWAVSALLPTSGTDKSAFTEAPLPNQSILSFHFYTPPELNSEAYAQKRLQDAQRLHVYPLLSETCCLSSASVLQRLWWFEKAQIGWIVWEYKTQADGHGYGAPITGVGPDMFLGDTPIKGRWRRLSHPSAQRVHGEVVANIFDFTHGAFNLTFVPTHTACNTDGHDAIIKWPWTWWAYLNVTAEPKVKVHPAGAASVAETTCPDSDLNSNLLGTISCYGVNAHWRNGSQITISLAFEGFTCIDIIEPPKEPPVSQAPWWGGLGWPMLLLSAVFCFSWSCLRCGAWLSTSKGKAAVHSCIAQSSCELEEGAASPSRPTRAHSEEAMPLIHGSAVGLPEGQPAVLAQWRKHSEGSPEKARVDERQESAESSLDEPPRRVPAASTDRIPLDLPRVETQGDGGDAAQPQGSDRDSALPLIEFETTSQQQASLPAPVESTFSLSQASGGSAPSQPSTQLQDALSWPKAQRSTQPVPILNLPDHGEPWRPQKESGSGHCPSIEGVPGLSQAAASRGDTPAVASSSRERPEAEPHANERHREGPAEPEVEEERKEGATFTEVDADDATQTDMKVIAEELEERAEGSVAEAEAEESPQGCGATEEEEEVAQVAEREAVEEVAPIVEYDEQDLPAQGPHEVAEAATSAGAHGTEGDEVAAVPAEVEVATAEEVDATSAAEVDERVEEPADVSEVERTLSAQRTDDDAGDIATGPALPVGEASDNALASQEAEDGVDADASLAGPEDIEGSLQVPEVATAAPEAKQDDADDVSAFEEEREQEEAVTAPAEETEEVVEFTPAQPEAAGTSMAKEPPKEEGAVETTHTPQPRADADLSTAASDVPASAPVPMLEADDSTTAALEDDDDGI